MSSGLERLEDAYGKMAPHGEGLLAERERVSCL
jgi:hypothetical protein